MYDSIVYDLDGTLIDSAIVVTELLNELRAERDLPPLAIANYKPWLSVGGRSMIAAALGIKESDSETELAIFRRRYLQRPTDPATLFPAVRDTLGQLQTAGVRLCLCTNKPRVLTDKVLTDTGLADFFTVICAGNDLPTSKPHPDNLRFCLNALDCQASDTLVVGDSIVDQRLAAAGGTAFAFFSGGYDDGVALAADTLVIHRHPEILNLLSKAKEATHRE